MEDFFSQEKCWWEFFLSVNIFGEQKVFSNVARVDLRFQLIVSGRLTCNLKLGPWIRFHVGFWVSSVCAVFSSGDAIGWPAAAMYA